MANVRTDDSSSENVRMGPLALFTLVAIVSLAMLAVLALSTAQATNALAQRRATATTELYLVERAAQTYVATLDEQIQQGAAPSDAARAAEDAAYATAGDDGASGTLSITASHAEATYSASFDAGNGRQLEIEVHVEEDGSLSIRKWRMMTVVNEEPTMGNLFGSSRQEG